MVNSESIELLRVICEGASKSYRNAKELFAEALLLCDHGGHCRALCLHQISMEECGKVEILGGSATSLLMGNEVNLKDLSRKIAKHIRKNYANAYMLAPTRDELDAQGDGDWQRAMAAFNKLREKFDKDANKNKNASLYVDVVSGAFLAPRERITPTMVADIGVLNKDFLGITKIKAEMLATWISKPDETTQTLSTLRSRLAELSSQPSGDIDLAAVMQELCKAHKGRTDALIGNGDAQSREP